MAFATKIGPYLDALVAHLSARIGLDGVTVTSGWVGPAGGLKSIQLTDATTAYEHAQLGQRRKRELVTVRGFVWGVAPGAGETAIKASRDQAEAILNELMDELGTNPSQGIDHAQSDALLSSREDEWSVTAKGERATRITFEFTVTFQILP